MGRLKGPDERKIKRILEVLRENPEGLWIRELARRSGLSKTTVHRYVTEFLGGHVEEALRVKESLLRVVRLKGMR